MSRRPPISPTEIRELGWTRVDPEPRHKLSAAWNHPSGWKLRHCGHPTAHWPWALYEPGGALVCVGLIFNGGNGATGYAWRDLRQAMHAVREVLAGRIKLTGTHSHLETR